MTLTAQYRPYRDEDCADTDQNGWHEHEPSIRIYEKTTETMPYHHHHHSSIYMRRKSLFLILSFSAFVGIFGFILGYFSHGNNSINDNNFQSCPQLHHDGGVIINSSEQSSTSSKNNPEQSLSNSLIRSKLLSLIEPENIRDKAKEYSRQPHLAASPEDVNLALKIYDFFKSNHFDKVVLKNYSTLLSLPDPNRPNFVSLIDGESGGEIYSSPKSFNTPFFSPYSPREDVTGEILFVNYGRPVDYFQLQNLFNVSANTNGNSNNNQQQNDIFSGKIFLMKQFHLSASEQYKYATALNASAVLFYPDPQHYNPHNRKPFPDSLWLPPDGVRNDGIFWNGAGDPETFGLPSNPHAFRNKFDDLVSIPAQPISAEAALEIMKHMQGLAAPDEWKGGFNITYRIGPSLLQNLKVRVSVHNRLVRKTIHNVIGTIRGNVEPDRYVLIGNQRDSMSNGAVDSATGTGTFLEIARVFGNLTSTGWRPRRSLVFCSWGAEEFNLAGSTEFVEDTFKILYMRAVAYINVNLVVNGNDTLSVAASPLLYHTIFNATKDVFLPPETSVSTSAATTTTTDQSAQQGEEQNEFNSIYDKWIIRMPKMRNISTLIFKPSIFQSIGQRFSGSRSGLEKISEKQIEQDRHQFHRKESSEQGSILKTYLESAFQEVRPHIRPLDMYGSYAPFFTMAGIPVLDICFINVDDGDDGDTGTDMNNDTINHEDYEKISFDHLPYPLLHTQYDKIEAVENFIDPKFKYHQIIAQLLTHSIELLSNSLFLPFNIFDYAQILNDFYLKTRLMQKWVVSGGNHNNNNGGSDQFGFMAELNNNNNNRLMKSPPQMEHSLVEMLEIDFKSLQSAIENFTQAAIRFHARQDEIDSKNSNLVRQINDQLLLIERQFLDHRGIPSNNLKRHLILSPAEAISSGQWAKQDNLFPALLDELDQIMGTVFKEDVQNSMIRLQKHLPILVDTIQAAANSLALSGDFF